MSAMPSPSMSAATTNWEMKAETVTSPAVLVHLPRRFRFGQLDGGQNPQNICHVDMDDPPLADFPENIGLHH